MPSLQQSLDLLLEAMVNPMIGPPRRPTHIRISDASFAALLQKQLADLAITVEVVDRCKLVGQVMAVMSQNMAHSHGKEAPHAITRLKGMTPERVGALYRASASFYQQAPWRHISDALPLKVSCPAFSHNPVYMVVMGEGGMEFGLGLFFRIEDLERIYAAGGQIDPDRLPFRTASLLFSEPQFLAFDDLDAIDEHNWPVAGANAYPMLYQVLPQHKPPLQPPSPEHIDIFEACLLALPKTIAKHQAALRAGQAFAEDVEVETFQGRRQLRIEAG